MTYHFLVVHPRANMIKYWASEPVRDCREGPINLPDIPFPEVETISPSEREILRPVLMRHRHDGAGGWIAAGIGMALGFAIFHVLAGLFCLLALAIWGGTSNWKTGWRRVARGIFVVVVVLIVLVGLVLIFAD
jgi:hypothetical protein